MEKTKVIFRMWYVDGKDELIALFPEIPSDATSWYCCMSYQHVGQHSGCDPYYIIRNSIPATIDNYAALYKELESIGYDLVIMRRFTATMNNNRRIEWEKINAM